MSERRWFRPWDSAVYALCIGVVVGFSLFAGPIGVSRLLIEDGRARFTHAPCRDQICVYAGPLSDSGAWAACLPNRVFLSIAGRMPQDADAIDGLSF